MGLNFLSFLSTTPYSSSDRTYNIISFTSPGLRSQDKSLTIPLMSLPLSIWGLFLRWGGVQIIIAIIIEHRLGRWGRSECDSGHHPQVQMEGKLSFLLGWLISSYRTTGWRWTSPRWLLARTTSTWTAPWQTRSGCLTSSSTRLDPATSKVSSYHQQRCRRSRSEVQAWWSLEPVQSGCMRTAPLSTPPGRTTTSPAAWSVSCTSCGLFTSSLFVQDFRKFPFDNQTCNLIIHSFGSSTKDYTLKWGLVSCTCTGWPCPPPYCSLSSPRWMLSTGSSTLTSRKPCRSSRWACSS